MTIQSEDAEDFMVLGEFIQKLDEKYMMPMSWISEGWAVCTE